MRLIFLCIVFCFSGLWVLGSQPKSVVLSQDMFLAQRMGEDYNDFQTELEAYDFNRLVDELSNDDLKMVFWLNIYNIYAQIGLENYDSLYLNHRRKFFKYEFIKVAGESFSLDDIEHGILRRSQTLWGRGRVRKWFPGKVERQLRVNELDYRIHFGLNCGAKSCPPIAYFETENLDEQLTEAAKTFILSTSEYDDIRNMVFISKIFSWYRGDFGGKSGIRELLKKYGAVPKKSGRAKIEFKDYDWSVSTSNYAD